jgi:hypothetical protein
MLKLEIKFLESENIFLHFYDYLRNIKQVLWILYLCIRYSQYKGNIYLKVFCSSFNIKVSIL